MFAFGITDVFAHFYDLSALRISASCQFKSELRDITISDFSCESAACVCVLKFSTILIKSFTKQITRVLKTSNTSEQILAGRISREFSVSFSNCVLLCLVTGIVCISTRVKIGVFDQSFNQTHK